MEPRVRDRNAIDVLGIRRRVRADVAAVPLGIWLGLVQNAAVDVLPPFHVVEEESLVLVGIVEFPERHRASSIETKLVDAKLGDLLRSRVEIVAGIERIVPVEFPSGSVELFRAGLENQRHSPSGRESVICAVVGAELTELCDGINRRCDTHAACAATVGVFTTI